MKRTQIQLPDKLYERLKRLAEEEETSLADIIRRAGEYYSSRHPELESVETEWDIPEPEALGEFLSPEEEWRLLGNESRDPG